MKGTLLLEHLAIVRHELIVPPDEIGCFGIEYGGSLPWLGKSWSGEPDAGDAQHADEGQEEVPRAGHGDRKRVKKDSSLRQRRGAVG